MAWRSYLIMLLCFSPVLKTYGSDTVVVHSMKELESLPMLNHASFFKDRAGDMHWQQIMHQPFSPAKWRKDRWVHPDYLQQRGTLWFRFTLRNAMKDTARISLRLQIYTFFRELVVLSSCDTIIKRPNYFFTTARKEERMNILVPAAPGEHLTYLICIQNPSATLGPMMIMSNRSYNEWSARMYRAISRNNMEQFIFMAVILFITLHTLAQYFIRRRREFIWYALYSTSVILIFLNDVEALHFYDIFFSYFPYLQRFVSPPLFLLFTFLYFRFAREFVDFKSVARWYYRVIIWTERLALAAIVAQVIFRAFINWDLADQVFFWFRILFFAVSFTGIFLLLRSGKKLLNFFGIGSLLLAAGMALSMVVYYFPHINPFGKGQNMRFIEIGVILELLCFTAGLSYKSHLIEVDKRETQQRLIGELEENRHLREELNVKLEARAKALTEQVMAQQRELEKEKEHQLTLEFTKKIAEMELQLLKSQLNPHFYFNTLNNLYGLAMIAPKKAPDAILKLSDIMEYVIYDCRNDKVPLGKELKFLQSYIELEKLRYDDNARISMEISGRADNKSISPMLLIQFVENAFKHGIEKEKTNSFLSISIKVQNNSLEYESINSINGYAAKNGGVGLTNVRKRLDLLYPQKHDLHVIPGDNEFRVKLKLTL